MTLIIFIETGIKIGVLLNKIERFYIYIIHYDLYDKL
ncbi:hypothetical protein QJ854_gp174 [Moumouvirus goulette]|uniref:Uncharacterized protein n=1 Tax=Moumouvirus goulette TaxID=1247379 RepID=M1PHP3_9VIRU|nr:hypothetical protein QJ854_gp174 [Moumouvirus goulette]AGF85608.1 hypothetical protein glt_00803 [Moumouvirus goulette]